MFHEVTIVGHLGSDPEMRYMPDGTAVTKLSVATSKKYTDRAGVLQSKTVWFRVDVWGKQAENCNQYLTKGRQVMIKGELNADDNGNPRIWTSNTGEARASFEVRANHVVFLGSKGTAAPVAAGAAPAADDDDGMPF